MTVEIIGKDKIKVEAEVTTFPGLYVSLYAKGSGVPIGGYVICFDGSLKAGWIDPNFRGSKTIAKLYEESIYEAIKGDRIRPTTGRVYELINLKNTAMIKFSAKIHNGWHSEIVEAGKEKWKMVYISIEEILKGGA